MSSLCQLGQLANLQSAKVNFFQLQVSLSKIDLQSVTREKRAPLKGGVDKAVSGALSFSGCSSQGDGTAKA